VHQLKKWDLFDGILRGIGCEISPILLCGRPKKTLESLGFVRKNGYHIRVVSEKVKDLGTVGGCLQLLESQ
jgi:hypothetical protein